jgi:hypothetical protein
MSGSWVIGICGRYEKQRATYFVGKSEKKRRFGSPTAERL